MFQHCFCGKNTIFASVTWFSPARKDIESGLLFVDTTLKLSAIVPVDNLCIIIVLFTLNHINFQKTCAILNLGHINYNVKLQSLELSLLAVNKSP